MDGIDVTEYFQALNVRFNRPPHLPRSRY